MSLAIGLILGVAAFCAFLEISDWWEDKKSGTTTIPLRKIRKLEKRKPC